MKDLIGTTTSAAFIYAGLRDSGALEENLDAVSGVIGLVEEACKLRVKL